MLCIRGHISAGFLRGDAYSCKVNTMVLIILLQVHKVNFLNRQQILIIQVKASIKRYFNKQIEYLRCIVP